ncbi:MAG: hypothetical protein HDR92_10815 [Bacteroides sp.]|nr:hypothetical protein [Bacteroides sp.]
MRFFYLLTTVSVLSLLIPTSCANNESGSLELDFSGAVKVVPDSFKIENIVINPVVMRVGGASLVLLNHKRDTIFDAFSTPDLTYESSGITAGNGPDEVPMVMWTTLEHGLEPDCLTFLTGTPSEIVTMSVPDFRIVGRQVHKMPPGWPGEQDMLMVRGDTVLAQRFDEPVDWVIVDGRGNCVATLDIPVPDDMIALAGDDSFTRMLIHSSIGLAAPDGSRVAVCTKIYPSVNIFDNEGRRIITVSMPYTPDLKNSILAADCNSKGIYICYHDSADKENKEYIIASIDWNGHLMQSYRISGLLAAPMAVDNEGRYVYFGGYDDDNLYRITL